MVVGGHNFAGSFPETTAFEGNDANRDLFVRHIVEKGTANPKADANWTFKLLGGATVLFDTGPKA